MSTAETQNTIAAEVSRLVSVETELHSLKRRLKREAFVSTFVTVVVLLLLSFYFVYGYSEFSKLLRPTEIVNLGASLVDSNIPVARQAIEDEVKRSAPVWAEQLSQQAVDAMPELRSQLEKYALEQTEQTVNQFVTISRDQFRNALREHREEFQDLVTELSTRREATDELVEAMESALNKELGQNMQANAAEVLQTVRVANDKLLHLSIGKNLTDDERQERYVLTIFRRLQMEENNNLTLTGNSAPFSFLNAGADETSVDAAPVGAAVALAKQDLPNPEPAKNVVETGDEKASNSEEASIDESAANARVAAAEEAEQRARAAESAANKAAAEQQTAARAAQAATDLARVAAKDAREATAEARKTHDELRKAEKDARAAIKELIRLQELSAKKSDDQESESDDNLKEGSKD